VPPAFHLINIRDRLVYDAKVVWNRGAELGLAFQKTVRMSEIVDPKLSYLTRLWFGLPAR